MTRIASVVLTTLSLFLGMFFFFTGFIKISPQLNRDIHREIRRNFVRYSKVIPGMVQLGYHVSPKWYRLTVGYSEVLCGMALAFVPGTIKQMANLFLILMTFGAIYTHVMIDDKIEKMAPALAFCAILICRLILYCLLRRRRLAELKEAATSEQPDTGKTGSTEKPSQYSKSDQNKPTTTSAPHGNSQKTATTTGKSNRSKKKKLKDN